MMKISEGENAVCCVCGDVDDLHTLQSAHVNFQLPRSTKHLLNLLPPGHGQWAVGTGRLTQPSPGPLPGPYLVPLIRRSIVNRTGVRLGGGYVDTCGAY